MKLDKFIQWLDATTGCRERTCRDCKALFGCNHCPVDLLERDAKDTLEKLKVLARKAEDVPFTDYGDIDETDFLSVFSE